MDIDSLLDQHDYAGAQAELLKKYPDEAESLDKTWILAEIEERCGDSLFFGGKGGAAIHYQAAQRALVPPGMQFSSREENDRRMEAYGRIGEKLYGSGQPHPRFVPMEPEPEKPPIEERRAAVIEAREARERGETEYARLFRGVGHWGFHDLGDQWCEAGKSAGGWLSRRGAAGVRMELVLLRLYNKEWSAHLPASRWDSDGGLEMQEVDALMNGLAATGASAPAWAEALLDGDWERAKAELGDTTPAPEFEALRKLLAGCT